MIKENVPLGHLHEGETATVDSLELNGAIRRRVQELGLIPGTKITCVRVAPAGSPVAYGIRGAVVALRRRDAMGIKVSLWD